MQEMESWSWPPRYDNSYRPADNSRYWFPVRETMDPGKRDKSIVQRLREVEGTGSGVAGGEPQRQRQ